MTAPRSSPTCSGSNLASHGCDEAVSAKLVYPDLTNTPTPRITPMSGISDAMIEAGARAILVRVPHGYGMTKPEADEYARACLTAALSGQVVGWQPIETAPKDGTKIWGWLYDSGIVLMHWVTAEQNAAAEGSDEPGEYISCWVKSGDPDDGDWSPPFWMPFDSVGAPPGIVWTGRRWRAAAPPSSRAAEPQEG